MSQSELLIITGMSGAGRSSVANALEDHGWYVINNLPPLLLGTLADLAARSVGPLGKLAVVLDVRSKEYFLDVQRHLTSLYVANVAYRVLFLDASDEALVARFEKEGRPHPLEPELSLIGAISAERRVLNDLLTSADLVIDTSELNVHELSTSITELFSEAGIIVVKINVMSFGFKYGLPVDANHVADVRFLPNPHWIPELQPLNGLDAGVRDYVLAAKGAREFLDCYAQALEPVIEGYRRENKHYVNIAVGCTGGKHRSVAMATALMNQLSTFPHVNTSAHHRDLGRE